MSEAITCRRYWTAPPSAARHAELSELRDPFLLEALAHPALEVLAGVQPLVRGKLERLGHRPVAAVLEALELHLLEHQALQLVARVSGRDERGRDRPGGRAGDPLGLEPLFVEVAERAGEADALDAATLEHQVDTLLITGRFGCHRCPSCVRGPMSAQD
jgi:hypothetical protein